MNPLTPLELLDILEQKHGFESPALREALTELEELKRDVKRFMELEEQDTYNSQEEYDEFGELYDKLSKVGKEDDK